jgi:hypothetical protein
MSVITDQSPVMFDDALPPPRFFDGNDDIDETFARS